MLFESWGIGIVARRPDCWSPFHDFDMSLYGPVHVFSKAKAGEFLHYCDSIIVSQVIVVHAAILS